jgi:hypothetical protein
LGHDQYLYACDGRQLVSLIDDSNDLLTISTFNGNFVKLEHKKGLSIQIKPKMVYRVFENGVEELGSLGASQLKTILSEEEVTYFLEKLCD